MTEHRGLVSELKDVVRSHAEVGNVWSGLAHRFHDVVEVSSCNVFVDRSNSELLGGGFDDIIPELEVAQPCVVLVVDGRAVSICRSVRKLALRTRQESRLCQSIDSADLPSALWAHGLQ